MLLSLFFKSLVNMSLTYQRMFIGLTEKMLKKEGGRFAGVMKDFARDLQKQGIRL